MIPEIVENTRRMARHTEVLEDVAAALRDVTSHTKSIPPMDWEVSEISGKLTVLETVAAELSVLQTMDARMAEIEAAMPVLVDVQRHLAQLPETMDRLDDALVRLSGLMEQILAALGTLNGSVEQLQSAVEPMGRLANRVPGQRKGERG
jgi:prophage DNA circulation protein